ncbi:MAG: AbrB/MazE/SpoVT family DNA-binding domain-containing protein [Solirubrobacterales bacterium]
MTYKVGPKGQVVVPKAIRDRLGIMPGDEVVIDEVDGEIRIRREPALERLIGIAKGPGQHDQGARGRPPLGDRTRRASASRVAQRPWFLTPGRCSPCSNDEPATSWRRLGARP